MPFECHAETIAGLLGSQPSAALRWRKCVLCGSVSYAPPGSRCGLLRVEKRAGGQIGGSAAEPCGGELSRPPGWRTQFAPRWGDGRLATLEYVP